MENSTEKLPDKMTGKDLQVQETYEESIDKNIFDSMDMVDRRDKRNHITSKVSVKKFRSNYNKMKWDM